MKPTALANSHPWPQRARALLLACACALASGQDARGQNLSEGQLRVRFLVNFMRFTEWPQGTFPTTDAPIRICVLGVGDALGGALAELQGTNVGGHRLETVGDVAVEQSAACHLIYAPDSELRRLQDVRNAIGKRAVLIVGESDAVLDRGGMIALRSVDRHLGFVVKLGTARNLDLNFSPQMLHAAVEVLP